MSILDDLLATPSAPVVPPKGKSKLTSQLELSGDAAEATINAAAGEATEGAARALLVKRGEDPDQWVVTSFRSSEWTMPGGRLGESNRYSFARVGTRAAELALATGVTLSPLDLEAMIDAVRSAKPKATRKTGDYGYIVAIGDLQVGKIDGDGVEGTVQRAVAYIDKAADAFLTYSKRYAIGHVHIAWLGDHIEGFVSQGGANVWRTQLTLNEQIRIVRRLMLYAIEVFAPLVERLTVVAIPGNHGEPQRFQGKGVTRYDDSHDTEALIAVHEALQLNQAAFGHVEIYVPDNDEETVVLDIAGTITAHAHGHRWRPGQHMKWWQGQAFGGHPVGRAVLLLAGHLHHFFVDTSGDRMFLQVPAVESLSQWWLNATGEGGCPGIVVMVTRDGLTSPLEVIR